MFGTRSVSLAVGLLVVGAAVSIQGRALAQPEIVFEVLPGSSYSYLVGGFSPVPDCDGNDDTQCDFGLSGTFTFDGQSITEANLVLDSPLTVDPIVPGQLTTAERVEDFLEGLTWAEVPPFPPTVLFDATNLPGPGNLALAYDGPGLIGATGNLMGGYDARPVDGDGVGFNATLRIVPEPATALLITCGMLLTGRRR
ncbi:MAG: hypothetical protein AAF266_10780 [Planctomycetota bacterium]